METKAWFFPDSYLREMEELTRALYRVEGKRKEPDIKDVLLMAQAFGVYMKGQVEKAGGISNFLKGVREAGCRPVGRTEQRQHRYYEMLKFIDDGDFGGEELEEESGPDLSQVWQMLQDAYQEHAPKGWPQLVRRSKLGKMGTRLQEGVDHAGGVEEFVALFASALRKMPEFYQSTYVRKGDKLRPVTDCILCLLSADKNHKELGTAGWRMFEWADLMEAAPVVEQPKHRHPAEEFLSWTGTRWSYRRPDLDDAFLEEQRQLLIAAGFGPADS